MSSGWIKLHRQMLDWEWYDDINTKVLFFHLLLKANHKDKKYRGTVIKRGQLLTGRELLSAETGLSQQQIRTCLTKLKSTSDITIKSTSKGTMLTIDNYGIYQGDDTLSTSASTSKSTNEQPTSNQQVTTNKNDKNIKEVKEYIVNAFNYWWEEYPIQRRKNKKGCLKKFADKCKGLSDEQIKELTNKIAKDIRSRVENAEDVKYIPMTEPYLNQERWMDYE